jgi:hypothetical protein
MAASPPRQLMMIELQVQVVVPSQMAPAGVRHDRPEQQALVGEHS